MRLQSLAAPIQLGLSAGRTPLRLFNLYIGLILFGVSVVLMIRAGLGLYPWDVFHQGIAHQTGLTFGDSVILVSAAVLLLWFPLRQMPGIGTISNAIVIGLTADALLPAVPTPGNLPVRVLFLLTGVLLNGAATGLYIGAGLGPGPRDGLMTGLAARGYSIWSVRASIEVCVLAAGWLLGGTVGVGTLLYALSIGPLAQFFIPRLSIAPVDRDHVRVG